MLQDLKSMTRRELLKRGAVVGGSCVVGIGYIASTSSAWALEVNHLKPATMATLLQMARDIYPHDHVADEFYAAAVKGYDTAENAEMVEAGGAALDAASRGAGHASYVSIGWERDRGSVLRSIEQSSFFQAVRGGLITGLYNQKAVWPLFGYEGESFSQGGYLHRGFDDINWV